MLKKVGELKVDTSIDYRGKIVEALENSGYTIILNYKTYGTSYYDIAIDETVHEKTENR